VQGWCICFASMESSRKENKLRFTNHFQKPVAMSAFSSSICLSLLSIAGQYQIQVNYCTTSSKTVNGYLKSNFMLFAFEDEFGVSPIDVQVAFSAGKLPNEIASMGCGRSHRWRAFGTRNLSWVEDWGKFQGLV